MIFTGVSKAVNNVTSIIGPALVGMDPTEQKEIDDKMVKVKPMSLAMKRDATPIILL